MNTKNIILKKILFALLAILLVFAILIILSYENSCNQQPLINNKKILTLTNDSIIEIDIEQENTSPEQQMQETYGQNYTQENNENQEQHQDEDNEPDIDQQTQDAEEKDIKLNIVPLENNLVITGIVQINILNYSENTDEILFMIYPRNSSDPLNDENTLIDILEKPFNLEFAVDSTEFNNGEYYILTASTYNEAPEEEPWTSTYKKEVIIEN